jgi:hypothetical protein
VENFDDFEDKLEYGPRAISIDISVSTPYLYGIPEHAA